jgi:DNA-binding PadR family transcriptional regulator
MANTKTVKKTTRKTAKKKTARKKKTAYLDDVESSMEKLALDDFAETTKEELKHLGDKIHEATDKGVHVARDIAEEVRRFTRDATELTKLKMEIHHLKVERDKLYKLMGEQLRNLHKVRKLGNIRSRFKDDFQRLDELEAELADREKMASGISLNV